MTFNESMDRVAQLFEATAAIELAVGLVLAIGLSGRSWHSTRNPRAAFIVLRESFGGVILLGLEILVAADLIRTVAVAPTLENIAILGIIVAIRTVLSFSLETEIEGVAPWRRLAQSGVQRMIGSTRKSLGPTSTD